MAVTLLISLYTSRVVLGLLGFEDFGIYNVICGVVALFTFFNNAMRATTQRFLNFANGSDGDGNTNTIFCSSFAIHLIIALVVLVLSETIGLWLLYTKINISIEKFSSGILIYQTAIVSTVVLILTVPYNAVIIAREKMTLFAIISVADVVLRLIVALCLNFFSQRLIAYSFLLLGVQIIIFGGTVGYCRRHFRETRLRLNIDKHIMKEMAGFASWSLIGSGAYIAFTQGINLILNIFFGPTVNAARAIAVQVQSATLNFVGSFQTAINPQIVKSYACKDLKRMHDLLFSSCRLSFFLLLIILAPLFVEIENVLDVWLGPYPDHTVSFVRIIFIIMLVDTISNPCMISAQATGRIRNYQLILGTTQLLIVPIAYMFLRWGFCPEVVFIVHLCIALVAQLIRLKLLRGLISLSIRDFIKKALWPIANVTIVALLTILLANYMFESMSSNLNFIIKAIVYAILVAITILTIGVSQNERKLLVQFVKSKLIS